MPVYDYRCVCKHTQEAYRTIESRAKGPNCEKCSGPMYQIISGGFSNGMKGYPYDDPILERRIESPRQKRDLLRSMGLEQKS